MTSTPIQPTPEQLALAGPSYGKDDLATFLQEIQEEDAALAAGTLAPPDPAAPAAPDFATLTVEGDEVEAEGAGEQRPLAGKFKSVEELERSYLELQKKLGQPRDPQAQEAPPAEPQPLDREQAVGAYGEAVVAAAEKQGIDLARWDAAVRRGEDTSEQRTKLATELGLPAALIEQYEAGFRPAAEQAPASAGLSEADAAAIKAEVGGDQQFAALSQWALSNLSQAELADYNTAVNTNAAAARAAVRWLQARAASADREPDLVLASGGNANPALDVFETEEEAMAAKTVTTKTGKQRYLVDEKYRRYIDAKFARSPIFL